MIGFLLGLAVLAAVAAAVARRRPGATIHRPVTVRSFDEIDAALQGRSCWCGGSFVLSGETSRTVGDYRFRVARLVCNECERDELIYFDVTAAFHCADRRHLMTSQHLEGPADMVVEIVPESDPKLDYREKLPRYREAGIEEIWVVNPFNQEVLAERRTPAGYIATTLSSARLESAVVSGFWIEVAWLW